MRASRDLTRCTHGAPAAASDKPALFTHGDTMELRYGSVCSGIEAASVAWHALGFVPAWFGEIAAFPSAVLAERWPDVPNRGDFTRIDDANGVDVLVGGTPCQSFSVAGGRAGLDDPRGHLAVEFLRLARRLGARWLVWENVPGVFSVDDGDAFATFIALATECGYGVFWRVLDAQFVGVPQRRRRVFVVGHLGDWRPSCAVLLERPSMRRNSAARRGARAKASGGAGGGAGSVGRVTNALTASGMRLDPSTEPYVMSTLGAHHPRNAPDDVVVADTLRACAGKSTSSVGPLIPGAVAFHAKQDPISGAVSPACGSSSGGSLGVLSFDEQQIASAENRSRPRAGDPAPALSPLGRIDVLGDARPRRLTPREWERLQGFPDDYTSISGASDSARYEALGNSMAVPVMRWIGRRLQMVNSILEGNG